MNKPALAGRAVYVVDGLRTAFLKTDGRPAQLQASDLALQATRPMLLKHRLPANAFDEVVVGCVSPGANEANIARVIALRLGLNERTPAWTVQRNCASGLQALDCAALNIASGRTNLALAGGTEAMSRAPVQFSEQMVGWLADWSKARSAGQRLKLLSRLKPAYLKPVISLLRGLTDPFTGLSMGQTAENLAEQFHISRTDMDAYSLRSHQRLGQAVQRDMADEIAPLYAPDGTISELDNGLRTDSSLEKMAKLRPVFDRATGAVTAGNSAQVTDGAAMLVLASEDAINQFQLPVIGRILDSQWAGLDPTRMGLGPVYAMQPLLARNQLGTGDIGCWEINEAFAAQVIACQRAWQDEAFCREQLGLNEAMPPIPDELLNLDGGGISLGHPVGASGARIVLHALRVLRRTGKKYGMASLCIGGGQGGAMLLEALS